MLSYTKYHFFKKIVALELLNPQNSTFWKKLISLFKDTGLEGTK